MTSNDIAMTNMATFYLLNSWDLWSTTNKIVKYQRDVTCLLSSENYNLIGRTKKIMQEISAKFIQLL